MQTMLVSSKLRTRSAPDWCRTPTARATHRAGITHDCLARFGVGPLGESPARWLHSVTEAEGIVAGGAERTSRLAALFLDARPRASSTRFERLPHSHARYGDSLLAAAMGLAAMRAPSRPRIDGV